METKKIKIFIIEDDKEISEMYKIKFEKEWFDVKIANDWFEALTMLPDYLPDIILLDIMMPSMDGIETLKTIRELAPTLKDTKIVVFSNLNSPVYIEKVKENWADDFLLKASYTPKALVEKINSYFDEDKNNEKYIECPHCWEKIILKD